MARVTGIGGIFFKVKDVKATMAWYQENLGIAFGEHPYVEFKWINEADPATPGSTVFSFFKAESTYFDPSPAPFMINFRVDDLAALLEKLSTAGVQQVGGMQEESYGRFAWILDPDGNKIELYEAKD